MKNSLLEYVYTGLAVLNEAPMCWSVASTVMVKHISTQSNHICMCYPQSIMVANHQWVTHLEEGLHMFSWESRNTRCYTHEDDPTTTTFGETMVVGNRNWRTNPASWCLASHISHHNQPHPLVWKVTLQLKMERIEIFLECASTMDQSALVAKKIHITQHLSLRPVRRRWLHFEFHRFLSVDAPLVSLFLPPSRTVPSVGRNFTGHHSVGHILRCSPQWIHLSHPSLRSIYP